MNYRQISRNYGLDIECPACGRNVFGVLIDFGGLTRSGVLLNRPENQIVSGRHAFDFCKSCALIRNYSVFQGQWDYKNEKRVTGPQLPIYASEVVHELKGMGIAPDGLVVDIGGNDGEFLNLLKQSGWRNLLNVEPAKAAAKICLDRGHRVENVPLGCEEALRIKAKYGAAKAVFCRHVLEHVHSPLCFLKALKLLMVGESVVFIEVPDARGIMYDLLGHELWDQHLYHFTETNMEGLLARSGFQVKKHMTRPHRGGRNVLVWARLSDKRLDFVLPVEETIHDVQACREFSITWNKTVENIMRDLESWPRPIVSFGASHPQSNYLLLTGVGRYVSLLVDDDPAKIGKWLPIPKPARIVSTKDFLSGPLPGTILRTAFGCESWMDPVCRSMAEKGVHVVDPYPKRDMKVTVAE